MLLVEELLSDSGLGFGSGELFWGAVRCCLPLLLLSSISSQYKICSMQEWHDQEEIQVLPNGTTDEDEDEVWREVDVESGMRSRTFDTPDRGWRHLSEGTCIVDHL